MRSTLLAALLAVLCAAATARADSPRAELHFKRALEGLGKLPQDESSMDDAPYWIRDLYLRTGPRPEVEDYLLRRIRRSTGHQRHLEVSFLREYYRRFERHVELGALMRAESARLPDARSCASAPVCMAVGEYRVTLAQLAVRQNALDETLPLFEEALEAFRKHEHRDGSAGFALYDASLGAARIYAKRGRLAEAETAYNAAIQAKIEHQTPEFQHAEDEIEELAAVVEAQGRTEEARELHEAAADDRRRAAGMGLRTQTPR